MKMHWNILIFKNFPLEVLIGNIIYTQVDYLAEFEALLRNKVHDNTSTEITTNSQQAYKNNLQTYKHFSTSREHLML